MDTYIYGPDSFLLTDNDEEDENEESLRLAERARAQMDWMDSYMDSLAEMVFILCNKQS